MPPVKYMRIALIETKTDNTHVFSRVYLPRLGVPILGSILNANGYEVELFFQHIQALDIEYLRKFDIIGLSAITSTVNEAYKIGKIMQEAGKIVVIGGPHASAMSDEALNYCNYVIRGEGEITFLHLLEILNKGGDLSAIPGISYRLNGSIIHNPSSIEKVDMGKLIGSDFSLCKSFKSPEEYPAILMFSRGCPYDCNFCSVTTTFGRKYRYKTIDPMINELSRFHNSVVCFIDDNFAANPKMTKNFCAQ